MAIFNAWCERVPMLIYGGNGPMDAASRRPWVDWMHTCTDQAALVRHYIKWDNQPASLAAVAEAMLRAAMIAQTPPCAPTYVIFDSTLQEQKLDKALPIPDVARYQAPPPAWPASHIWDRTQRGVFPKGAFGRTGGTLLCSLLRTTRGAAWWRDAKGVGFAPAFAADVDAMLAGGA